jgi:dihydropteroate synthase
MGIVNVTPDSFSDGGDYEDVSVAIEHGLALMAAGADLVDVGGESTRPGSAGVPAEVELARVLPVVRALADAGAWVSIDTRKPAVAEAAVAAGAHMVNDVTGLANPDMVAVCAELGVPAIAMHMKGDPVTMQLDPTYDDVVAEVSEWLDTRARQALDAGVPSVLVDPGIGFGKTLEHNLALLRSLDSLTPWPVVVGASRKRSIGELAGEPVAARRDPGSIAAHLFAIDRGAAIVRVHDVAGHVQAVRVWSALADQPPQRSW